MQAFLAQLHLQLAALSTAEIVAVVTAIAYLLLAIRQNIWCWFCAAISSAIYVYLFIDARLYMEAILYAFYFAMAAYGWFVWHSGAGKSADLPVTVWPLRTHAIALIFITAAAALTGFLLRRYTDAVLPYIDSLTTFAAIWTTFLVARKVLENWWYWLVIDTASIAIYWSRDLQLTSLLFVFYVILVPFGLLAWRRSFVAQASVARPT